MLEAYAHSVMNTFGPPKRVFVRGEGCHVWDADGRRYLDLLSGLAVNALGHAHPTVLSAITGQIATLGHVSNFFATPAQVALAERLAAMTGGDGRPKVFFTNSGTEANEAAFKITRMTGRTRIVAAEGAFHGRSLGALAHHPQPEVPRAVRAAARRGDLRPLRRRRCAGRGGRRHRRRGGAGADPGRERRGRPAGGLPGRGPGRSVTQHGALLWIDEVQTGMGRTGCWLVHVAEGVTADIVTVAKGLGNGFPVGACIATGRAATPARVRAATAAPSAATRWRPSPGWR